MPTVHLLRGLRPLSSVRLGRLVLNAKNPHQDCIDPFDDPPADPPAGTEFDRNVQQNFKETRKFSKCSKLRSYLGNIISISYERQNASIATLSAPQATTYDLKNSGAWFKSACAGPETRRFLEGAIDNRNNVYLIVGFRTVQDATLVKSVTWQKAHGAKGEVPAQLLAAGVIPASIVGKIECPGVGGIRDIGNGQDLAFNAPGEQVFAILYRKVKFKWMSSRSISNMSLEPNNRWISCWDWRGPDEEDEEDDVLEANLTDVGDADISDDEYLSEDETSSLRINRTPEKEDYDMILVKNPTVTSGPDIMDEEHASGDGTGSFEEQPSSLADMEEATEQVHKVQETRGKRRRGQGSADEPSKRLKVEMAAAEKSLRASKARKKVLGRSLKRQKSSLSGKGDRIERTKP